MSNHRSSVVTEQVDNRCVYWQLKTTACADVDDAIF